MYHSITFGDGTLFHGQFTGKNTWSDWHLIPSSRPAVGQPAITTNYLDIPGRRDGPIDASDFLTGKNIYGQRSGSFDFIVDQDFEYWETVRSKIVNYLHGKHMKMCLEDDPGYYYEGRFSVGDWRSGSWYSQITISYNLKPYKYDISTNQRYPI